jgi:trans-aconitate methyltransferase
MPPEADRILGLYQRYAREWDRERSRSLTEKSWLDEFLRLLPSKPTILDLGCGSAEPIARYLIEKGSKVTGIDSSPTLIDLCKQRFPDQSWTVADMRELSLNAKFDGILAWDSFFHLCPQDQRAMFPIFRQHAKPNAGLMFTSGPSHGEAIGKYKGEVLYHGSLDEAEYRSLLNENGFEVVAHTVEDPTCDYHTVWLAKLSNG